MFRFVDLFAGIGGMRAGLEAAGGVCVYSVERDPFAVRTYEANFGPCEARDIRDVQAQDIPDYDLMSAGFPCQPFSLAGVSKKRSLGRSHGFADEESGNLFFQIIRLIRERQELAGRLPPILLLENVKHLLRHDRGNTFSVIYGVLKGLGYNLSWDVVDAQPWVPQHRERTFIVGLHRDVYGSRHFAFPGDRPAGPWPTVSRILDTEPPSKYTLSPHLWEYLQAYAQKHRDRGNGFGYGIVGPQDVTRTLSARYHKDGSEILVKNGDGRPRRLTPRECARLMGFAESFQLVVSDTQAYRQFGNSVVVPVVSFLAAGLVRQKLLPVPRARRRKGHQAAVSP
jgi:DNA (cytosine-5)-methyltransferase 1